MQTINNELEFNPFTQKGNNAIEIVLRKAKNLISQKEFKILAKNLRGEEFFINNFYVEPFTQYCLEETVEDDDREVYLLNKLKIEEKGFRESLKDNILNICWVYGNAGCGKTTYIHKLHSDLANIANLSIHDFEKVPLRVILNENKNILIGSTNLWEKHHCYKFCILLIYTLIEELNLRNILELKANRNKLQTLYNFYKSIRNLNYENDYVTKFFDIISDLLNGESEEKIARNIQSFFSGIIDNEMDYTDVANVTNNVCRPIVNITQILLYILLCKGNISKKCRICTFDNIEYYISVQYDFEGKIITDKAVEIILNSLGEAVGQSSSNFSNNHYEYVPKFIVLTRQATVHFNHNGQGRNHSIIEITNWFWAKQIYEKKIKFLNQYTDKITQRTYQTFLKIMSDCTDSKWSLGVFLPKLFNYDYRRLSRVLTAAIKLGNRASETETFYKNLDRFDLLWESAQADNETRKCIRHLCRIYIIRLLLNIFNDNSTVDEISTSKIPYFTLLMVETKREKLNQQINHNFVKEKIKNKSYEQGDVRSSYVRKILTILHRVEIEDGYRDNENITGIKYFAFEYLLRELFLTGNHALISDITEPKLKDVAQLLYLMNKVTDKTNWVPLTSIKWNYDGQNYSIETLKDILISAKNNIVYNRPNNMDFGIHINYAGQMFLRIMPEFEYFAVRFCPDYPCLFEDKSMKKRDGHFVCEDIIDIVLNNVLSCINKVIARDTADFSTSGENENNFKSLYNKSKFIYKENGNSKKMYCHPTRILRQQINYLATYKAFINSLEPNESRFKSKTEKEELLSAVQGKIDLYNYCEKLYIETYPNYFRY